jgi:hypothetical protein
MFAGNRREQRRLANTIAADRAGALGPKSQINVGEKRMAVRRGQRQVR